MCLHAKFEVVWTNENRVTGKKSWRIFHKVTANDLISALSLKSASLESKILKQAPPKN